MRYLLHNFRLSFFIACLFILSLVSCQKEVHINLGTAASKVVVQGQIETGLPPFVVLTSTISFFSSVDLATLEKSFIHGANVQVSDGSRTVTLREYALDTGASNKFYVYSVDTANLANLMFGQVNKFYTLTIGYDGKTYTSTTKIPAPKFVDTLWFAEPEFKRSATPDSARQLFAIYSDPDTMGNFVRYFTQRNSGPIYPVGIFSDEIVNGKKVTDIALFAGYEPGVNADGDSLRYFYPGDTVTLKWCEIDKSVYTFWNTYEFARGSVGNPFSSPINVTTNMSDGALGVWAGYGSVNKVLIVPH